MSGDADSFEIVALAVASARDVLEAPPMYGAFRLLDVARRIAVAAGNDPFLRGLADEFEDSLALVMHDQREFASRVDDLLATVAAEALRRNSEL